MSDLTTEEAIGTLQNWLNRDSSDIDAMCPPISLRHVLADLSAARASRDAAVASRDANKAESLELFTSFDCTWGIGSGRHCPADNPCMAHRFEAARKRLDEAMGLLRPFAASAKDHSDSCTVHGVPIDDETKLADYETVWGKFLTVGHVRRAATFLASCGQKGAGDGTGR